MNLTESCQHLFYMAFTTQWDTAAHIIHPSIFHILCNRLRVKKKMKRTEMQFEFSSFHHFVLSREVIFASWLQCDWISATSSTIIFQTPLFSYTSSILTFQLSLHQSLKPINISCVFYAAPLVSMLKDFSDRIKFLLLIIFDSMWCYITRHPKGTQPLNRNYSSSQCFMICRFLLKFKVFFSSFCQLRRWN